MKRVFGLLLLSQSFLGFSQGHRIDFEINGLEDSVAYIGYFLGEKKYVLDTVDVVGEKFFIEGSEPLKPGLHFIYTPTFYREFILNEQFFSFKGPKTGDYSQVEVRGSKENEVFRQFQVKMGAIQRELREMGAQLDELTGDDSVRTVQEMTELQQDGVNYRKELVEDNPGLFVAEFLRLMGEVEVPSFAEIEDKQARQLAQYRYYRSHFMDDVNLKSPGLVRTPLLKPKVMNYLERVIPQVPDTIIMEIDQILDQVESDEEAFRFWAVTFFSKFQESKIMGFDKIVVHMIENYYLTGKASWITEESKKKLQEELAFVKPNLIGNPAPKLYLQDTLLNNFSVLNTVKHPYMVLFFYDPDCGHCKKKMPVLRKAYDDLQALDTEVVAVCTTTEVDKWKKFIREKDLGVWVNAADTDYRSNFRMEYNVRSTPQVFVLDEDRKIIAKKLDVDQLVDFMKRYQAIQPN